MIDPVSESSQSLLEALKYFTTAASIVLSSIAAFALARYLPHATSAYRSLLMTTTVISALSDFYLQILMDPVFLIPLPCMYYRGILDSFLRSSIVYETWVSGVSTIGLFYLFSASYRNQILLPPNHRFRLSSPTLVAVLSYATLCSILQGPILEFAMEKSEAVMDSYTQLLSDRRHVNIRDRILCIVPQSIPVYGAVYAFNIGVAVSALLLICVHTLHTLNRMQVLSEKTRQCHRRLTNSLIAQMLIPGVTIILPSIGIVTQHVRRFEWPEFIPLMLIIIGVQSSVHSLTVIFSTDFFPRIGRKRSCYATACLAIPRREYEKIGHISIRMTGEDEENISFAILFEVIYYVILAILLFFSILLVACIHNARWHLSRYNKQNHEEIDTTNYMQPPVPYTPITATGCPLSIPTDDIMFVSSSVED